jgi:AraC family transcriptional activator of pobA
MDESGKRLHVAGERTGRANVAPEVWSRSMPPSAPGAFAALGAEGVGPHFAARHWALRSNAARPFIHLLCLTAGNAAAVGGEGELVPLTGPTLAWLPAGCAEHLEIAAGACAHLLRLKADIWHRQLPASAEPAYLDLAGTRRILAFAVEAEVALTVARSIAAIAAELTTPARSAALSIVSSELTLCVLRFWRLFAAGDANAHGNGADILSRFRRLLEERYHQHLQVADYASLLGVTPDRLHALCSHALKRSPSALIQERILQEAVARLETSTATVKQIAFALGFKDTAYFNRFFAKHVGEAPGAWRRSVIARRKTGQARPVLSFADWP